MKKRVISALIVLGLLYVPHAFASESDTQQQITMTRNYEEAQELMRSGSFEAAAKQFEAVKGYRLSDGFALYCRSRSDSSQDVDYKAEFTGQHEVGGGTWNDAPDYVLYLPDEVNKDTSWVLYFPGSCGEYRNPYTGASALYKHSVESYLEAYSPDAVMMFWRGSGMYDMTPAIEQAYHTLESIAHEYGIAIHDLVTAGSSNGGYTAVKCAGYLYQNYGVPVSKVLVYDMGEYYMISHCLPTVEDCKTAHDTGTKFFFFEQSNVSYQDANLSDMIKRGMDVQLIYCKRDAHTTITYDGFSEGTLSWAIGEQETIREDYYTFPEKPQEQEVLS